MVRKASFQLIVYSLLAISALCQKAPDFNSLSFNEIRNDFDTLYSWLKQYHINLYGNIPKLKLETDFKTCRNQLYNGITEREYFKIIATFLHSLKDGHTYASIDDDRGQYFEYKKNGGLLFPFKIKIVDGNILVTENFSNNVNIKNGFIIKSINGRSSKDIIHDMIKLWSADYYESNLTVLERNFAKSIWYYYGWENFKISYQDLKFSAIRCSVKGIPIDSFSKQKVLPKSIIQFQIIDQNTCLLKSNSYVNKPGSSYKNFLDSCFTIIKENHLTNLIFDLRDNSGGNSSIGDTILSYFNSKPYLDAKAKIFRINNSILKTIDKIPALKDHVLEYLHNGTKINDEYFSKSFQPEIFSYHNDSLKYEGNVYVLISPYTYSSAHMTAMAVKCSKMGILIGEPTGERLGLTAESIGIRLPNTRILLHVPIARYLPFCGSESTMGVVPDKIIKTRVADVINGEDPLIKYIINKCKIK